MKHRRVQFRLILSLATACMLLAPHVSRGTATLSACAFAIVTESTITPNARDLLALAEAKLTESQTVRLIERQGSGAIAGRANAWRFRKRRRSRNCAVLLGKLASVDLYGVAEISDDPAMPRGCSRIRCINRRAALGRIHCRGPQTSQAGSERSLRRRDRDRNHRRRRGNSTAPPTRRPHYICMMTVRNADLSHDKDGFCAAVGKLVERRLAGNGDWAVVERARLQTINKERNLPTESAADKALLASVTVVELQVGAAKDVTDKDNLRVTALLSDAAGNSLGSISFDGKSDASALADGVVTQLAEKLRGVAPAAPSDAGRHAEALRFYRETVFFWAHHDKAGALREMEAAVALEPSDLTLQALLVRAMVDESDGTARPRS